MSLSTKSICVIGLGQVGLPTALLLAHHKISVFGYDINTTLVHQLNLGKTHITEPKINDLLQSTINSFFHVTETLHTADIYIIAVPTPINPDQTPDLSCVYKAVDEIAAIIKRGDLIIVESTVPIGTTQFLYQQLASQRPDLQWSKSFNHESDVGMCYCPERVLPGNTIQELRVNDRVLGGITKSCAKKARETYQIFSTGQCHLTDAKTAELVKLSENAYRDVNCAFANELSLICDQMDINANKVIGLANRHPRVNILQPGPGVGGHCLPIDPKFLIHGFPEKTPLIKMARYVNDKKPHEIVKQIMSKIEHLEKPIISCLGLTYKADVNDFRESPAIKIVESLARIFSGNILVADPYAQALPPQFDKLSNVHLTTLNRAINSSDLVVILVNHQNFQLNRNNLINEKMIIDTCGFFNPTELNSDRLL